MKCVCRRRCQIRREDGVILFCRKGDVVDMETCPANFEPIEGEAAVKVDFDTAQEQELLESDFDLDDLVDYIRDKYGRKAGNRGKDKIVELLMDCRFRDISSMDLNKVI